jgi:hypothetical protein
MTELEKLLDKIYWHADAQGIAQAQILSAFADKDKRIAELEKKYEAYKISNYDPSESIRLNGEIMHQKNRIAELEAQVAKLKCCGNCASFMIDDHHVLYCENDVYPFPILGKCDRWEASHE